MFFMGCKALGGEALCGEALFKGHRGSGNGVQ